MKIAKYVCIAIIAWALLCGLATAFFALCAVFIDWNIESMNVGEWKAGARFGLLICYVFAAFVVLLSAIEIWEQERRYNNR